MNRPDSFNKLITKLQSKGITLSRIVYYSDHVKYFDSNNNEITSDNIDPKDLDFVIQAIQEYYCDYFFNTVK